jgi:hypothetical protein
MMVPSMMESLFMGKLVDLVFISQQAGISTKENGSLISLMVRERLLIKTILLIKET